MNNMNGRYGFGTKAFVFSIFISYFVGLTVSQTINRVWHQELDAGFDSGESKSQVSFPLIYKWSKRDQKHEKGCHDPTEPFLCPGSNICISLQFLCDGHPNDCPNNYDEDQALCVSAKRPAKHTIMTLLSAQVNNHGTKFIEYIFGKKALSLFDAIPHMEAINIISIALSVSPTIEEFANVIEMTREEKKRFSNVLESLNNGQINDLPPFIINSAGEGMSSLAHQLIKTQFLAVD